MTPVSDILRMDPTRTTTLSKKIALYFQGSYVVLSRALKTFLLEENIYMRWEYLSPEEIARLFMVWLDEKFEEVFAYEGGELEDLLTEAYVKGAKRSYSMTEKPSLFPSKAFAAGAAAEFIRSLTSAPESKGNLGLIQLNATTQYKLINTQLKQNLSRIVSEGLISGLKPAGMASKISLAIDKTNKTRAKLLARTETTRAHAEGQLDAFNALGLRDVEVKAEWSAAADACEKCAPFDGEIFSLAEAHGMIPLHPNCKCLWIISQEPLKKIV